MYKGNNKVCNKCYSCTTNIILFETFQAKYIVSTCDGCGHKELLVYCGPYSKMLHSEDSICFTEKFKNLIIQLDKHNNNCHAYTCGIDSSHILMVFSGNNIPILRCSNPHCSYKQEWPDRSYNVNS